MPVTSQTIGKGGGGCQVAGLGSGTQKRAYVINRRREVRAGSGEGGGEDKQFKPSCGIVPVNGGLREAADVQPCGPGKGDGEGGLRASWTQESRQELQGEAAERTQGAGE